MFGKAMKLIAEVVFATLLLLFLLSRFLLLEYAFFGYCGCHISLVALLLLPPHRSVLHHIINACCRELETASQKWPAVAFPKNQALLR
jgi:hypothetical protein